MATPHRTDRPRPQQRQPGLLSALALAGWRPGLPDGMTAAVRDQAEDLLWRQGECPVCRGADLLYRPLHRGREYLAVYLCRRCGHAEEF